MEWGMFAGDRWHRVNEGDRMPEPGVEVVWGALERALRKAGHDELWLQFRPHGSKDVFDAVQAAVQVANQEVEDAGWGSEVFTEGVSDSDAGPMALMSRVGTEEGVRAWFAAFAGHLQALGLSGKVTAAPQAFFPDWLSGAVELPRQLTAFVSYQTNDLALLDADEQRRAWHVPAALTAKVADAATEWAASPVRTCTCCAASTRPARRTPTWGRRWRAQPRNSPRAV
jgi:hypothetical protein